MSQLEKNECGYNLVEIINGVDLPYIIMLHGYGASMLDLAPIASVSPEFKKFNWVFPDAKIEVPIGPHTMGKAWFPIDMTRFETGVIGDLYSYITPAGMNEACEQLAPLIKSVSQRANGVIIGGFSQGSMMALELCLQKTIDFKMLVLLSSTLVNVEKLKSRISALTYPIFQSHGTSDAVLPFSFAKKLQENLDEDTDHHFFEFSGGHEIPPYVLSELINMLKALK
jgi:phospholipase/carboxylesterase